LFCKLNHFYLIFLWIRRYDPIRSVQKRKKATKSLIFGSGIDPILLVASSHLVVLLHVVLVGATIFENPNAPSFQIGSGWNSAALFFKYR